MPAYASRDVGDPTQIKKNKQSMADLKLRRLTELNNRLREDLDRERIPVSQAAKRFACKAKPLNRSPANAT
jgi:guanine nucleotide-binding protein subunit gamma